MATLDWPEPLVPQTAQLALRKAGVQFASPFNGATQAVDFVAERWTLSCSLAQMSARNPRGVGAFCNQLAGGVNRVRVWPFHTRGTPRGSLRGTPTLAATVNRGAVALQITGATAPAGTPTLLQGDYIGAGGQLFEVAGDVVLTGGAGAVAVVNRVRATIAAGAAVVWLRPTCEMILPAMLAGPVHRPGAIESTALDLVEVW